MKTPIPIILDGDMCNDCDDPGALHLLGAYQRLGYCNVLGVAVNTSNAYAPGAADAVRTYLGLPAIPISTLNGTNDPGSTWTQYVYNNFARTVGLASSCPTAVSMYRQLLAASSGGVTICSVGFLTNLSALLQSTADGYSSLTGLQLVTAKVSKLIVMGGDYPTSGTAEYNFLNDKPAAAYVCANWPTPIVFTGFTLGNGLTAPTAWSANSIANSPTYQAYHQHGTDTRPAWDLTAAMIAVEGTGPWETVQGANSVNTSTGVNTFTPGAGSHSYVQLRSGSARITSRLNDLLNADPLSNPVIPSWASASAFTTAALGG